MADEPIVVSAVGSAASTGRGDTDLAQRVEAAMSQAVKDAAAEGIAMDDVAAIKERMMAARQKVLDEANTPPLPGS